MKKHHIHVVALDVPYPADYGAIIDCYYRLAALKKAGVSITLHAFEYGRGERKELLDVVDEVIYYKRKTGISQLLSKLPYIVKSRMVPELVDNLCKDNDPIFFEGQHTCGYLQDERLENRLKMVRIHNIEWEYYALLNERTAVLKNRIFYWIESKKLKHFDSVLKSADVLFCVSHQDLEYYRKQHPHVVLMPSSSPFHIPETTNPERERYAIYHANLSIEENEEAATWILEAYERFDSPMPLVITGKNPSKELADQASKIPDVQLIANPNAATMQSLIEKAGVQLLITFQNAGIKLKLINSLVSGGICIANRDMINGTDLGQFCEIVTTKFEFIDTLRKIENLYPDVSERQEHMRKHYAPDETVKRILEVLENA